MTGAKGSNNPWKDLAARIVLRAVRDYQKIDIFVSNSHASADEERIMIQFEAENWLYGKKVCGDYRCDCDLWCQSLLDFLGIDITGIEIANRLSPY